MQILFWVSFFLILYVYVIYPFLIYVFSRLFSITISTSSATPHVSIIITAYNEEKHIAEKIENTLSLDYSREKMEIIVGSDGSTDRTADIVRGYEPRGIKLIAFSENRGKTLTQNDCVKEAQADIIVFMDAASLCEKGAVKKLVRHFADPKVGVVAGKIQYIKSRGTLVAESQGVYWQYEQVLKIAESRLGSLIGVDGPLYAVRKSLYQPLNADMISDLISPLLVRLSGHYVILDNEAVTFEETTASTQDELKTRRRIVLRGFTGLFRYPGLFNPFKHPLLSWQIISHKILRWMVGIFFVCMFLSACFLINVPFYAASVVCMSLFLILSLIGFLHQGVNRAVVAVPYYFVLVNVSAFLGLLDFLSGRQVISWKPVRN